MIGQSNILKWVDSNINSFPHFIVLSGTQGSGKRTLAKYISVKLSSVYAKCEPSVDFVREVIQNSYSVHTKTFYCFEDCDNMRNEAKNAMLKITEEPPENAYFCLTVSDDGVLLDTIKSRAQVIHMQPYTTDELQAFCVSDETLCYPYDVLNVAEVPGEIKTLSAYGSDFYDYVKLVKDNIAQVEPANAFKSSTKLALKTDNGYNLYLFWKCFIQLCLNELQENQKVMSKAIMVTSKFAKNAQKLGVNRQQLYDMWVFEIREVLNGWT